MTNRRIAIGTAICAVLCLVMLMPSCRHAMDAKDVMRVACITGIAGIEDGTFFQGIEEGLENVSQSINMETVPISMKASSDADKVAQCIDMIEQACKSNCDVIICPGYAAVRAVYETQDLHKDIKFICIDGKPISADGKEKIGENTYCITYREHEAGFLAGAAAAMKIKQGSIGFLGGLNMPSVRRYGAGFQQGIEYANTNFDTQCSIKTENIAYVGSFNDVAGARTAASKLYDAGVKIIFAAAGGAGIGAISEARTLSAVGEEAYVVGVDTDQYDDGIYIPQSNYSVVVTSAMKKSSQLVEIAVLSAAENDFHGGEFGEFGIADGGVALSEDNPNLDADTKYRIAQMTSAVIDGTIAVNERTDLFP